MIVTIDGTDWLYGERAVRRHVVNLVKLVGTFGEDIEYRIFLNRFLRTRYPNPPQERARVSVKTLWCPQRLWRRINTGWNLVSVDRFAGKADVYHAAGANVFRSRAPHYVYTVGGLAAFVRPDLLPEPYVRAVQAHFRAALPRITHFVAVSETTRRELMRLFDIPPERITAIPLGVDAEFRPLDPEESAALVRRSFSVRRPYVLYVGGIQRNKNIVGLVEGFLRAAQGPLRGHQLVLVGPRDERDSAVNAALAQPGLEGRLVLTGTQHGDNLVRLYSAADLFVFPTHYEGWTSPPLEAMACGVPVVASRASSVPETVGDAALLVDPGDPEDIAEGLCRVREEPSLRSDLRRKGLGRAAAFTWERCVRETVNLYLRLGDRRAERR